MATARVDDPAETARWERLILAATEWIQKLANVQLLEATFRLEMACWPASHIILPRSNQASVTQIEYRSPSTGTLVVWDDENYQVVSREDGSTEIWPDDSVYWPATNAAIDAIQITYTAGTDIVDVPPLSITAVEQLAIRMYEDPMCEIPPGIHALIGAFRVVDARLDAQMAE